MKKTIEINKKVWDKFELLVELQGLDKYFEINKIFENYFFYRSLSEKFIFLN